MHDIIVFENLHFRPPTREQKDVVFKNLHSGERFWKKALSMTFFTGYVWTVGQPEEKYLSLRVGGALITFRGYSSYICNCNRRVLSTLTLGSIYGAPSESDVAQVSLQSRTYSVRFGTWKYGVWTRPKSTREWVNKINLSSFQIKNFSKFLLGWSARENQNILTSQPCLHTLMQTRLSANQSEYTMLDI